jgi:3'-phosphoadenosine 5'-phosphosulfate sulfotransferase (PAPS reductase)/FAD synthetase
LGWRVVLRQVRQFHAGTRQVSRLDLGIGSLVPLFPWQMEQAALGIIDRAVQEHKITKLFGLFSGGHDSLSAVAVASEHPAFTAAAHLNTGIGIQATRQFVSDTCQRHGWPLLELWPPKDRNGERPGKTYHDLVVKGYRTKKGEVYQGFPNGPKSHHTMYYHLKQRQIRRLVREHKSHRLERIGLVTGVRSQESTRRMTAALAVEVRRDGCQVWINPILSWTKDDCNAYIGHRELERNIVVDVLHRSGECLCGALASPGELPEIEDWYPKDVAPIREIERECAASGIPGCKWADAPPGCSVEPLDEQWTDLPLCVGCMKRSAA